MTGMWLNIALIAVILHQCYCMDIDCNNMFPESPDSNLECHQEEMESQNEGVTCDVDAANIKWTVMNTASGTLSVEFNLIPQYCGGISYELDLFIYESVTNAEECEKNNSFPSLHSRRSLEILYHDAKRNSSVSLCGKTAVETFKYVFSGCYVLEIAVEGPDLGYISNNSERRFITTEYKKDLLIDKKPNIIQQYFPALQQIDVSVQFQSIEALHIGLRLNSDIDQTKDSACYVSGHDHSCCIYGPSGQFMCKTFKDVSNKPSCRVVNDVIKCTINNITTGFYCMLVEIFDDRCKKDTVWNNKSNCLYNSKPTEVVPVSPDSAVTPPPEELSAASDAILVVVVLAVVMVCLCALVLIYRRRTRRRSSSDSGKSSYVKNIPSPHRPRILLLYARDCELFMNMMITFRQVLKEVTACEVYDCFDPVALEQLCQNKTDWLLTHIRSPDVKIVLVESKCAVLQQMALMQHMKVIYKDPMWLDDLFLYGLRVLLEDLQTNVYERVFVVRIHDFTEENDKLCHITPYTRYVVPQNTEKLLSCLYQESAWEHVLILKEDNDDGLHKLQDNIRKLQVFKQQNGDYLNKLLETVTK